MNQRYKNLFKIAAIIMPILAFCTSSYSQPYGNEWIVYGNTYYKFGITQERLYRITKSKLDEMGMGGVSGSQFAIFREGKEVPIYVTTNGTFGDNDFIEFYGNRANGKMDTELYMNPNDQASDDNNIISDTAFYFITYSSNPHQRIEAATNVIPNPAPAAEPYFWYNKISNPRPRYFMAGKSYNSTDQVNASTFDVAEGYTYITYNAGNTQLVILTRGVYTGNTSLKSKINFSEIGLELKPSKHHYLKMSVGNTVLFDTSYGNCGVIKKSISVQSNILNNSGNTNIVLSDTSRFGCAYASILFPRTFNYNNYTDFRTLFELPSNGNGQYLNFTNFNSNGQNLILIDITNQKRYTTTVNASNAKFYLSASSSDRKGFLCIDSEVKNIDTVQSVTFKNFTAASNQGNYIIISHKNYINANPNHVQQYEQYRESSSGGGYNVVVADVTQLYDEFGYGYTFHPLGIKHFLKYAYDNWSNKPELCFIIGKGLVYTQYLTYSTNFSNYEFSPSLVPTFGNPGSDILFTDFNNDSNPEIAIGRLSAWNNDEIGIYLNKVKAYENELRIPSIPDLDNTLWKKTALHIAGGTEVSLQQGQLLPSLNTCKNVYVDSFIGGKVFTVAKNTTDPVQGEADVQVDSIMNAGANIVTFYGHGSSTSFDYAINNPDVYNSNPRYPLFFGYGCDVAQIFKYDRTVGENYLASVNGGSVSMVASDNFGYTSILSPYMQMFYRKFCRDDYGKTLGEQMKSTLAALPSGDLMNIHKQCIVLQGDPALSVYNPEKVDYYTDDNLISATPSLVTTSMDSFNLRTVLYNLGKATNDSVLITITKQKSGSTIALFTDSVYMPIKFCDTLNVKIPVDKNTDIGLMVYTVKINPDNIIDEITYQKNKATLQLFISDNGLIPVYPQEFAIMHNQDITLKASALNLFGPEMNYKFEIDTTALFNSSLKQTTSIQSKPGLIKWKPALSYKDSTVYYWRTASDQLINGEIQWRVSSFIYLANGSDGWNQSHYYQYLRDTPFYGLRLPSSTRKFQYSSFTNNLYVINRVLFGSDYNSIAQYLNGVKLDNVGCVYDGTIQIVVFDSTSGQPWGNPIEGGIFGSTAQCPGFHNKMQFEYSYATPESRNNIVKMLDSVPEGNYILIKNFTVGYPRVWNGKTITDWQADAAIYGVGNTLYDKFIQLGFTQINQFDDNKLFIFFRKKGDNTYPVHQVISQDSTETITLNTTFVTYPDTGTVTSTIIGPAKKWNTLKWHTSAVDNIPQNDSPYVNVYGVTSEQHDTILYSGNATNASLSFIEANKYPYLKLVWNSIDNINRTSPHLNYWRVLYDPLPEAALNPLAYYKFTPDTFAQGQSGSMQIAIENITPYPMDSMLVKYRLIDNNNVQHDLSQKRYKKLPGNDTLIASIDFTPTEYTGNNILFVEANPNNDQPEQYHPNNLAYIPFMVNGDKSNPVLDVTFDGVHILDKDIVSAKPFIKGIMLDENKYLALKDTSLLTLKLAYPPDQTRIETIPFDGTICKFVPANLSASKKNQASIEFKPTLKDDGVYKLIISGKDVTGNVAGSASKYEINFTVENKPSITNILNYPNPFSTSTAFVFTMTGSQIPSQFKIQIMTVTGKIVREITKYELGPLHIGRNITEYKWDGRDQFGQLLGNGVYLYRVVTSIEGNDIEHRTNADVDKYFKHSFGKMYIMR